jgi:hypothetical protein
VARTCSSDTHRDDTWRRHGIDGISPVPLGIYLASMRAAGVTENVDTEQMGQPRQACGNNSPQLNT